MMTSVGLIVVIRRRTAKTVIGDQEASPANDLLHRGFNAELPNRLRVAGPTFVPAWNEFLDLSMVVDLFSRRLV